MDMIVLDELRGDSTDLAIIILPDNTAKQHHKAALGFRSKASANAGFNFTRFW